MVGELPPGTALRTAAAGMDCVIDGLLGSGGQGEVYRARLDGGLVAVKWYHEAYVEAFPNQIQLLEAAISSGPPDHRFLWPLDLVSLDGSPSFGYIMPLRDERFVEMTRLVDGSTPMTLYSMATAGFQLADSFGRLHLQGFCYRDISFGNVFANPATGAVTICDNDNVGSSNDPSWVGGTPKFIAPELVRGESVPNRQTDLWSLAVLLFYLLMQDHPLDGAREASVRVHDDYADRWLYGDAPIFIFDPADDSNRPVNDVNDHYQVNALVRWPLWPGFIRDLFRRSFTLGALDPDERVGENEWREAMSRLRDSWFRCQCGAECFHDVEAMRDTYGGRPAPCAHCGREPILPPRVLLTRADGKESVVVLGPGKRLFKHHLESGAPCELETALAVTGQLSGDADSLILENTSGSCWTVEDASGQPAQVAYGDAVALTDGREINFAGCIGLVHT